MSDTTKTETIGAVIDRQVVRPEWMERIAAEHGWDAEVAVTTRRTPFGNFVVNIEVPA